MEESPTTNFRFEVAISFAGDSKRDVIRRTAQILRQELGPGKVFFDEWFEAEIAGPDAHIVMQNIYRRASRLVVTCVCKRYEEKPWTQEEWRAIQAFERDLRDAGSANLKRLRLLLLRFDDGEIDGIFETAIVPDVRQRSPKQIAELILERLRLTKSEDPSSALNGTTLDRPSSQVQSGEMTSKEARELSSTPDHDRYRDLVRVPLEMPMRSPGLSTPSWVFGSLLLVFFICV